VEEIFPSALQCAWVRDIRQTKIHTEEPLVPKPSDCEVEMIIRKLKRHTSPCTDQIPTYLIENIWNKE